MRKDAKLVPVPFPMRGVDVGQNAANQPPLTTRDAMNVRAVSANGQRGLGRRPGLSKAVTAQVSAGPVRALSGTARTPVSTAPSTAGTLTPVVDDFVSFAKTAANGGPTTGGTDQMTSLAARYRVLRKKPDQAWVRGLRASLATESPVSFFRNGTYAGLLYFWTRGTTNYGDQGEYSMDVPFGTGNDMLLQMTAGPFANAEHENESPVNCGPYVRGSADGRQKICAYLEWTGQAHTVRLVIDKMDTTGVTRLATGQTFRLMGVPYDGSTFTHRIAALRIRIYATPAKVTATVTWPGAASTGSVIDEISVTNSDFSSNDGGGITLRKDGTKDKFRLITSMEYSRRTPYPWPTIASGEVIPTVAAPNPAGATDWIVPAGFETSNALLTAAAVSKVAAGYIASTSSYPAVDPVTDKIKGQATRSTRTVMMVTTGDPSLQIPSQDWGVEVGFVPTAASASTDNDALCPVLMVSSDHKWLVRIELDRVYGASTTPTYLLQQSQYRRIIVRQVYDNGAGTRTSAVLHTTDISTDADDPGGTVAAIVFSTAGYVRWQLAGTGGLNQYKAQAYINNRLVWESPAFTVDGSIANANRRVGVDVQGVDDANANTTANAFGFRVVNVTPAPFTPVLPGVDITAVTATAVKIATLGGSSWSACTGLTIAGNRPEMAFLGNKLWVVDGQGSYTVDLVARNVTAWAGLTGTDYDRMELVAQYRRRLFVARRYDNPSLWACSRINDAQDFVFGASDPTAKAYTGTAPEVGQPGDEITALIPAFDDYLIFGCRNSMWMLAGDPGFGGRVNVLSQEAGVISARAWCFDSEGTLWWLSPTGLYRMRRGTFLPVRVVTDRLGAVLRDIDAASVEPVLAYDPTADMVLIFLTPKDGSAGTHVSYDLQTEDRNVSGGLWLAQYPSGMQPLAVTRVTGDSDDDRQVLLGGYDGYVRKIDDAALGDDGTAIDAFVRFPALHLAAGQVRSKVLALEATLTPGSGAVDWAWNVADSPAELWGMSLSGSARRTGTWGSVSGGRQQRVGMQEAGAAHGLTLRQNALAAPFALEFVGAYVHEAGRMRGGA